jgi:Protein of unknown function (DUF1059)
MSKVNPKRKVIDCRLYPSEKNCSLAISGTEEEVLAVAVRHAVREHGHKDTPQLREELKSLLKDAFEEILPIRQPLVDLYYNSGGLYIREEGL